MLIIILWNHIPLLLENIEINKASTYTSYGIHHELLIHVYTADECSTIADCVENATCVNSPDGFVCLCPFGSMGDGRMSGNGCFLDECSSEVISDCVENATCVNSPDGFVCLCPFGSMGDGRMSGNGCFLDECSSISDCVENANCVNSPDGFVCLCPPDLTGDGRMSGTGCNGC
jgi:hypothetical protein